MTLQNTFQQKTTLFLFFCWLLISCQSDRSKVCEQVRDPLLTLDFTKVTRSNFPAWVQEQYALGSDQIRIGGYKHPNGNTFLAVLTDYVKWNVKERIYRANFINEELQAVRVEARNSGITLEDVVDCLGEPEQYEANYGHLASEFNLLDVALWYPNLGLVVGASKTDYFWFFPSTFNQNLEISRIEFSRRGNVDEMLDDIYPEQGQETYQWRRSLIKPWPGSWEKVQVEDFPPLR